MRILLAVVAVLAVLWGGWWWFASRTMEREAAAWFEVQAAMGRIARHEGIAVRGFPNRLDLTVDAPALYDPATGFGWRAPFAQVFALSYRPWHMIAALAPEQVVTTPFEEVALAAERLQASLVLTPGAALTLDRATLIGEGLEARGHGWEVGAGTLRIATRQAAARSPGHDLGIEVTGVWPDPAVLAALPAGTELPDTIDSFRLDLELGLSAPLDRHAGRSRPELTDIVVREARLVWGDMVIHGSGSVTAAESGLAEGRIAFRVTGWRDALAAAVAAGWIAPEVAPTWERALELMAGTGRGADTVDLPLYFRYGVMSLGPIPLGPAPWLRASAAAG